ncbi:hypothetical protein [Aurantiacibacter gilvus]|uniref:Uncharacterized protein n=1 Tax=Aurantiacibacter gilvus TaxID=3139141 RepID=A0ABU9IBQ7_9SPHN
MQLPDWLRFASDATRFGLWGGAFLLLSALSIWGDRRRAKRKQVDDVGLVPWRDIAALSTFIGLALMSFAVVGWVRG